MHRSLLWPRNGFVSLPLDVAGLHNVHHHVHGLVGAAGLAEERLRLVSVGVAVESNALAIAGHAIDVRRGGIIAFGGRHWGGWRHRWSGRRCCRPAAPLWLRHGQAAERGQRVRPIQAFQIGYVELALEK